MQIYPGRGSLRPMADPSEPEMNCKMSGDGSIFPRIASSRTTRLSNWVTLVENRVVASPQDEGSRFCRTRFHRTCC